MRELQTYEFLCECLSGGKMAALLIVVDSIGSSPGRQGFKMAVSENGEMKGSIGGGIMEHKFVEWVLDKLNKKESFFELRRQVHNKEAAQDQSGMICSGEQTILLVSFAEKDAGLFQRIFDHCSAGKNGLLSIGPDNIEFSTEAGESPWNSFNPISENDWTYVEKTGPKEKAYVIGAGHVGLQMCRTLANLGFHVTTFDDREGLNTLEENHYAHEKIVTPYNKVGEYIPDSENAWVIVMTFGYRTDDQAVRALLGKKFKYFGMMGSRAKVDKMLADLRRDGYSEEVLSRIHSPAGIQINSKTPAEIAVSIAAEIISIKNK